MCAIIKRGFSLLVRKRAITIPLSLSLVLVSSHYLSLLHTHTLSHCWEHVQIDHKLKQQKASSFLFKRYDCPIKRHSIWMGGRVPWCSGCGRRLVIWRLWVRIPAPYTGWTFFHICVLRFFYWFLKRPKLQRIRTLNWKRYVIY